MEKTIEELITDDKDALIAVQRCRATVADLRERKIIYGSAVKEANDQLRDALVVYNKAHQELVIAQSNPANKK